MKTVAGKPLSRHNPSPSNVIYALYDLRDPEQTIRYIGLTKKTIAARVGGHKDAGRRLTNKTRVTAWVHEIGPENLGYRVLEQVLLNDRGALSAAEKYWIDRTPGLLNMRGGGTNGRHSDESRLRMAEARREYWRKNPVSDEERARRSARSSLLLGEKSGRAILTEIKVREIRAKCATGATKMALSKEYGVSPATIMDIKHGRSWSHLL